ncbi:peptidoglycan DD-metalloendopeptidase family protein [Gemmatimonadota bacterium]
MPTRYPLPGLVRWIAALSLTLGLAGCRGTEIIREFFRDPTPHEAYVLGLFHAGLDSTALGREWIQASRDALSNPLTMDPPYREEGFFPEEDPSALGYRFPLLRGQRLVVRVELTGRDSTQLFVDLFRAAPDSMRAPVPLSWGEEGSELVYDPFRSGDYILRIQPELLRGGRFQVTIVNGPSLEFPVAGHGMQDVGSVFGAPRDAGRRVHHGVDIFARRGTPVIAGTRGFVSRADTTEIGGRVVWLRDEENPQSLYFAHLDRILTPTGTHVEVGDTLGFVGNTGNARTTPPHLHFGIYRRRFGPVDPWDFIRRIPTNAQEVVVNLDDLGSWVRIREPEINLRKAPSRRSEVVADLPRHTPVRVMGGVGTYYRVRLPDGSSGFLAGRLTEEMQEPIRTETLAEDLPLQAQPLPHSPVMDEIPRGADVPVLGAFGGFLYVRAPSGTAGWVPATR